MWIEILEIGAEIVSIADIFFFFYDRFKSEAVNGIFQSKEWHIIHVDCHTSSTTVLVSLCGRKLFTSFKKWWKKSGINGLRAWENDRFKEQKNRRQSQFSRPKFIKS